MCEPIVLPAESKVRHVEASICSKMKPIKINKTKKYNKYVKKILSQLGSFNNDMDSSNHIARFEKSRIDGWGVFAANSIANGDLIFEIRGENISQLIVEKRLSRLKSEGKDKYFIFQIDDNLFIDMTHTRGLAKYINHSCDPNCVMKQATSGNQKFGLIYARREIRPFEELTIDYGMIPLPNGGKIKCNCGSSNCREYIYVKSLPHSYVGTDSNAASKASTPKRKMKTLTTTSPGKKEKEIEKEIKDSNQTQKPKEKDVKERDKDFEYKEKEKEKEHVKRKRGRPPLDEEEKERRARERQREKERERQKREQEKEREKEGDKGRIEADENEKNRKELEKERRKNSHFSQRESLKLTASIYPAKFEEVNQSLLLAFLRTSKK